MKNLLYVDACCRGAMSRTRKLAEFYLLDHTQSLEDIDKIFLDDPELKTLGLQRLSEREKFIEDGDFSNPLFEYAHKLKKAEVLVIAAPFWDLSFPASVKVFCENICVRNLTFCYTPQGTVQNLTALKKVVYISTAGGFTGEQHLGFEYIKKLFQTLFNVQQFEFYNAEGLDVHPEQCEKILRQCMDSMK